MTLADVAFLLMMAVLGVGTVIAAYERSHHVWIFAFLLVVVSLAWLSLE